MAFVLYRNYLPVESVYFIGSLKDPRRIENWKDPILFSVYHWGGVEVIWSSHTNSAYPRERVGGTVTKIPWRSRRWSLSSEKATCNQFGVPSLCFWAHLRTVDTSTFPTGDWLRNWYGLKLYTVIPTGRHSNGKEIDVHDWNVFFWSRLIQWKEMLIGEGWMRN